MPAHALLACNNVVDAVDEALDLGRLMQSAELVGVARQVLADSVAYLNTRQQFGRPLAAFQALQHRLVDAAMQVELAANSLLDALDTLDAQPGDSTLRKTCLLYTSRCV